MKKVLEFIETKANVITLLFVLIIFLKTCKTNSKVETVGKQVEEINTQINILRLEDSKMSRELKKEIKIEGLKSEKRMIQSTDRKILDVNRQSEIDKEISNLDK